MLTKSPASVFPCAPIVFLVIFGSIFATFQPNFSLDTPAEMLRRSIIYHLAFDTLVVGCVDLEINVYKYGTFCFCSAVTIAIVYSIAENLFT